MAELMPKPAESAEAFINKRWGAICQEAEEFLAYSRRLGFFEDRIFGEALYRVVERRLLELRTESAKHWGSNDIDAALGFVPKEGVPKGLDKIEKWMKAHPSK